MSGFLNIVIPKQFRVKQDLKWKCELFSDHFGSGRGFYVLYFRKSEQAGYKNKSKYAVGQPEIALYEVNSKSIDDLHYKIDRHTKWMFPGSKSSTLRLQSHVLAALQRQPREGLSS